MKVQALVPDSFSRDQHTAYIYSHIDWPPNICFLDVGSELRFLR